MAISEKQIEDECSYSALGVVPLRQSNPLKSLTLSSLVSWPEGKILMRLDSYESNHMINCLRVNLAIVIKT